MSTKAASAGPTPEQITERILNNSPRCQDCEKRTGERRVLLDFKFSIWNQDGNFSTRIYQCPLCKDIVVTET